MQQVKPLIAERYLIREKLGRGLIATSYLADDRLNNQRVVLKMLDAELFDDAVLWSKIRVQLQKIGRLRHPHILPILRGGQDNGVLYWTLPYMSGGSLADRLRGQSPLTADEIRKLLSPIAAALTYANTQGIAHTHLQPSNILFDAVGKVRIADFSLLPIADVVVESADAAQYVSPEQYIDQFLPIDQRADVYAVGGLLFRLVNGRAPYVGDSAESLAVQHLLTPLPQLHPTTLREKLQARRDRWQYRRQNRDLAPFADYLTQQAAIPNAVAWQPLFEKALAKQPQDRYPTIAELVADVPQPKSAHPSAKRRMAYSLFLLSFTLLLLASHNFHIAQLASPLRSILGVRAVTQLEEVYLTAQDQSQQAQLSLGLVEPSSPWEGETLIFPTPAPTPSDAESLVVREDAITEEIKQPTTVRNSAELADESAASLDNLTPFGTLAGEGEWEPYLYAGEQAVAWRTFLQPDEARAMTVAAVVALDLRELSLNYVWGRSEPVPPAGKVGNGVILGMDRSKVVATFNGGFLSEHGTFGAMADGLQLPAQYDLATVAIGADGRVAIGGWGTSLEPSADWVAWRQNAQMILQDGQITPAVSSNDIAEWGGTIDGDIVTWRSALGINQAGNILYYVAGSGLSMDALARTLQHAGADDAMLLDINAYWVHFAAIQNGEVSALFPEEMSLHVDRYLRVSERDFFYLSVKP